MGIHDLEERIGDYMADPAYHSIKHLAEADPGDDNRKLHALVGIGLALNALIDNDVVEEMVKHTRDTDHILELRLIDVATFGVRCTSCPEWRQEWVTKI